MMILCLFFVFCFLSLGSLFYFNGGGVVQIMENDLIYAKFPALLKACNIKQSN